MKRIPYAALTVLEDVNNLHGTTLAEMIGRSRKAKICAARHEAWARLYDRKLVSGRPAYSTLRLGDMFGRDHSTIMNGIQRHRQAMREAAE